MKTYRAILCLVLLMVIVFTLAVCLHPRTWNWAGDEAFSGGAIKMLLGEGRQTVAGLFYRQADVTLHSGYYPSLFSQAQIKEDEDESDHASHEQPAAADAHPSHDIGPDRVAEAGGFMSKPADWVESFGRHFMITEHTHLEGRGTREILPWLKMSAELDPHNELTYTVAAYWLRRSLGEGSQAEEFLREGLRANPDSYEILFELGRLYDEYRHDPKRAGNLWQAALRHWNERESKLKEPDYKSRNKILVHLAHAAEEQENYADAIRWFEQAKEHSPNPAAVQSQIDAMRARLSAQQTGH